MESGKVEVVAELLDCGCDIDAITGWNIRTALMKSSELKDLDMVRFLLQRGASTDPVDYAGYPAGSLCWRRSDHISKHSSMDVFKLLTENDCSGIDAHKTLTLAAMEACGSQIESLVHLGGNVHHYGNDWPAPMHVAGFNGNHSAYMATSLHYQDIDFKHDMNLCRWLLLMTIAGKVCHSTHLSKGDVPCPEQPRDFDKIMMNMLQRGVDPEAWLYLPNLKLRWIPAAMQGRNARAGEFAAAHGPDIEAWYLRMLRNCSLLKAHADVRRLRELNKTGYGTAGFTLENGHDQHEPKGDGAIDDPDTDEVDQFWDAEEGG